MMLIKKKGVTEWLKVVRGEEEEEAMMRESREQTGRQSAGDRGAGGESLHPGSQAGRWAANAAFGTCRNSF